VTYTSKSTHLQLLNMEKPHVQL